MKIHKTSLPVSFIIVFTALIWISSCRHDALIPANTPTIYFHTEVLQIFQTQCSIKDCHDGNGETGALNSYTTIRNAVTPFDPNGSPAYHAIISRMGENRMPPDKPITQENRTIIRLWIEQGANETYSPPAH
jgi:hypothetical protein